MYSFSKFSLPLPGHSKTNKKQTIPFQTKPKLPSLFLSLATRTKNLNRWSPLSILDNVAILDTDPPRNNNNNYYYFIIFAWSSVCVVTWLNSLTITQVVPAWIGVGGEKLAGGPGGDVREW